MIKMTYWNFTISILTLLLITTMTGAQYKKAQAYNLGLTHQLDKLKTDNKKLQDAKSEIDSKQQDYIELVNELQGVVNKEQTDNALIQEQLIQEQTKNAAVKKAIDSAIRLPLPNRGKGFNLHAQAMNMIATAYTNSISDCGKTDGITASGVKAEQRHTVAVDPSIIPIGSILYISYTDDIGKFVEGYYQAEDVGGAIKGNRLDVFFNTKAEVDHFGKRQVKAVIIR